ncbi:MAG TPA: PQQ-dependent sugar dehydrogenase [Pirellulaceae bacterium]|jgi:glucose/arabinose dehydrogenase|nr:PQQ-dependent sugar dehydrogenase [Pirellulaceae bacterium]
MHRQALIRCAALALAAHSLTEPAFGQEREGDLPDRVSTTAGDLKIERLAILQYPWGMDYLPDGRLLITEQAGRLRIFRNGQLSEPIGGVPEVVFRGTQAEQGGLLDVAVDPDFENNRFVYFGYVEAAEVQPESMKATDDYRFPPLDLNDDIVRGGAVARGKLEGTSLRDVEVIWRQDPKTIGRGHFGHRLLFGKDGKLYITSGERMRFDPAQSLQSNLGKIVRIEPDGSIPEDNPFVDQEGARGDIWSYGHRNILAFDFDPASGRLWAFEMGPRGGDEVNLIQKGGNYGWPFVSNGINYGREGVPSDLLTIPSHGWFGAKEYVAPVRTWTPVVSPSGAAFYQGDLFPQWRGSAFVGGLSSKALVRLVLEEDRVPVEERIDMQRRIRDVLPARDGSLLLLVDAEEGPLLRLSPVD